MPDEEERDDEARSSPPLPPDDRLWRHPSEMGAAAPGGARTPIMTADVAVSRGGRRWGLLVAGLAGATLTLGVVALSGAFRKEVVERQVVAPAAQINGPTPVSASTDAGVADLVAAVAPSVAGVRVETDGGVRKGSAVVLGPAGHLVTSRALLDGARGVTVTLSDGSTSKATIVGADELTGLAVLGVQGQRLTTPRLAAARPAVGSPSVTLSGSSDGGMGLVSSGVVSGVDQPVSTLHGALSDLIQTDRPTAAESDGGALVGPEGAVTGICLDPSDDPANPASLSGWAVPSDVAERVVEDIVADGHAHHAWLGVEIADTDNLPGFTRPGHAADRGAAVSSVSAGSPAEVAGLRPGDKITAVGDVQVTSMADVISALRRHRPGDRVTVSYRRASQASSAGVILRELVTS